jgi:hypothetical protein
MPPQCRTPPDQKPGYPPGPAPTAPLMAMVSMPFWTDDTSTAVRVYSSSWSPPDTSRAPFPHRSPRRSSANAARGGLKPPPDRRLRRAKPSSPTEHRFLRVLPIYIQTPIPRSWRTSGGPSTTALRWSPVESSQVAHTHQRDSAASRLLRVSPPARRASVLRPSRCRPLGNLPLAQPALSGRAFSRSAQEPQIRLTSPPCRAPPGR